MNQCTNQRRTRRLTVATAAVGLTAALAACGSDTSSDASTDASSSADAGGATLQVYAGSSLTAAFTELGKQFEAQHDQVSVSFSFGGSSDLVAQIQQGAPADVMASADTANMDKLTADDLVGDPVAFATNTLEIAVPPDNPGDVHGLADLAGPGLNLVVCDPEVPCGAAAEEVADQAGITLDPVSEEQSVTDVLGKVTSGEADAGLVYVTDVQAAGDSVKGITFPESASAVNTYPIATVTDSHEPDLAQQFVDLVIGEKGQSVLTKAGFGSP